MASMSGTVPACLRGKGGRPKAWAQVGESTLPWTIRWGHNLRSPATGLFGVSQRRMGVVRLEVLWRDGQWFVHLERWLASKNNQLYKGRET